MQTAVLLMQDMQRDSAAALWRACSRGCIQRRYAHCCRVSHHPCGRRTADQQHRKQPALQRCRRSGHGAAALPPAAPPPPAPHSAAAQVALPAALQAAAGGGGRCHLLPAALPHLRRRTAQSQANQRVAHRYTCMPSCQLQLHASPGGTVDIVLAGSQRRSRVNDIHQLLVGRCLHGDLHAAVLQSVPAAAAAASTAYEDSVAGTAARERATAELLAASRRVMARDLDLGIPLPPAVMHRRGVSAESLPARYVRSFSSCTADAKCHLGLTLCTYC